jgi:hypothetical protein
VRSREPIGTKHNREGLVSLQKIRLNLQASVYTPFEARGLLLGTVIRGTPNTPKHSWKTSSRQTIKAGKRDAKLKPHLPRDAISSHPSPASGKNSSPGWIHASPEGPPQAAGAPPARPRLGSGKLCHIATSTKSPYRRLYCMRIQCRDHLTPYSDTRASVGKVEATAVTSPLY